MPERIKAQLTELAHEAGEDLAQAQDSSEVEAIRVKYLGKKGKVSLLLRQMGGLPAEARPEVGQVANRVKKELAAAVKNRTQTLAAGETKGLSLDVTLPGRRRRRGRRHPVSRTIDEICAIFTRMGFDVVEGPEIELDYYNFEALNFPKDHPARDMQDTFYIFPDVLLRSHTSPVQVRVMERRRPPVMIISPGRVFRRDYDATHLPMFHQIEGLYVDRNVSVAHLKWTLMELMSRLFGEKKKIRMRPSFFPFTEPSFEVDVWFEGKGWFEILGAGMVHPNVLKNVGYDPEQWTGFAFGLGPDRLAMIKYGITDIRSLVRNEPNIYRTTESL